MNAAPSAGYSKRSLSEKLGIKEGMTVIVLGAPQGYFELLDPLPSGVRIEKRLISGDQSFIHAFVADHNDLERQFPGLKEALTKDGTLWISWPKGASKIATDLNENLIRDVGLREGLVDVKVAAIDQDWSGLKFVYRLKDRK